MRIALINENSKAAKNEMIYANLKKVAESKGHTVDNYGMYSADDNEQLTYVQGKEYLRRCFINTNDDYEELSEYEETPS